ncbi:Zip-domain-containing protein [Bimuria novae-zelandiae CBS 107.79]|uniref:Zip-domain-containing protein n=1 Tax=Bimuria novae-zelandiae CBS 107.79 TaxID=1447943 RepID=A0A6A5VNZ2_9PLEO|nr:Zip-domain-containing protein [Bimuria novae-zelandiae CBS 107.79]
MSKSNARRYCMVGTAEYEIVGPTATEVFEPEYTGCHSHGGETYCVNSAGDDVQIVLEVEEGAEGEDHHESHESEHTEHADGEADEAGGVHCHEHAGVPHCTGGSEDAEPICRRIDREYNKPLRIGLLFVILATSGIGVFAPILMSRFTRMSQRSLVFVAAKQFGTGVIISTAFVHLFTHASLMFGNECLGELPYEATTAAIVMAGLFLSFLVDYTSKRFLLWRQSKNPSSDSEAAPSPASDVKSASPTDSAVTPPMSQIEHEQTELRGHSDAKLNVLVLETGIIFHSLLIGLTLVVASDTSFTTLFIVVLFHQMFEGLALGSCIAGLPSSAASTLDRTLMATGFALITPVGMAIGIGVLDQFNGSDKATLVAIGTLDALSAGILAWVGIHEMLARDWLHGALVSAGWVRTGVAMGFLVAGLALMSLLGKWA